MLNNKIYFIRNSCVMVDQDIAKIFKISLKELNNFRDNNKRLNKFSFILNKDDSEKYLGKVFKNLLVAYNDQAILEISSLLGTKKSNKIASLILDSFYNSKILLKEQQEIKEISFRVFNLKNRLDVLEFQIKEREELRLIIMVIELLNQQIQKEDKLSGKMEELITVIKEGNKESVFSYVKKVNDSMDLITKASPAFIVLKTAIDLVQNYFK